MDSFKCIPEELETLARGLDDAADTLDEMGQAPVANAGESIALVAQAVARLSQASVGVSGGLHQAAEDLRATRYEYRRIDQDAADGMPAPPDQ
ncbi:hypothetical protein [Salinifilum ghardaiensis]